MERRRLRLAASVSPAGHHSATAPFTAAESSAPAPAPAEAEAESDGRSGRLVNLGRRRAANDDDIIIGFALLGRLAVDPLGRLGFVLDLGHIDLLQRLQAARTGRPRERGIGWADWAGWAGRV